MQSAQQANIHRMMGNYHRKGVNQLLSEQNKPHPKEENGFALFLALLIGGFFFPPIWIILLLWGLSKVF
jgi:hypothetical protein